MEYLICLYALQTWLMKTACFPSPVTCSIFLRTLLESNWLWTIQADMYIGVLLFCKIYKLKSKQDNESPNGAIRLLDFDYKWAVLFLITNTLEDESISWMEIPKNKIISLLEEHLHPRFRELFKKQRKWLYEDIKPDVRLIMRGESSDHAVICTKSATCEMKEVETSNSLLLVDGLVFSEKNRKLSSKLIETDSLEPQVTAISQSYNEVKKCRPKLFKLKKLLQKSVYRGSEYEEDVQEKYTFDELLDYVQASKGQLWHELKKLRECELDGAIRLLDIDYKWAVFFLITNTLEDESISWMEIPKNKIISLLEEHLHPREVLEAIFSLYTFDTGEVDKNGEKLYSLKSYEKSCIFAEVMLRPTTMFNYNEFLHGWTESLPEGMTPDLSHIKGLGIINTNMKPEVISYFNVTDLPDSIPERFCELCKKQSKWLYENIKLYVSDLADGDMEIKNLLAKVTRTSIKDDHVYYCSKW